MANTIVSANELTGSRVFGGKKVLRRFGKVRDVVYHPSKRRVIGYIVRRPDFLLIIKRKEIFVSINGYDMDDGQICIRNDKSATNRAAFKALGLSSNDYVLWIGLPVATQDGESFGVVTDVYFDYLSGIIQSIECGSSLLGNAMHGKLVIPRKLIIGFNEDEDVAYLLMKSKVIKDREDFYGAIIVSEKVSEIQVEDGLAQKAGRGASVVGKKAGKLGTRVSIGAKAAAVVAGTIVTDGAVATGKQLKKTKGMFSSFTSEYKKARHKQD